MRCAAFTSGTEADSGGRVEFRLAHRRFWQRGQSQAVCPVEVRPDDQNIRLTYRTQAAAQRETDVERNRRADADVLTFRVSDTGAGMTAEEVETSHTIAICHFNRVMLLSPACTDRGYDWLDTLCHEYVHYAVYRLGEDAVPVWLHEGLAKTLESTWRTEEPEDHDPRASSTLAEALEIASRNAIRGNALMEEMIARSIKACLPGADVAKVTLTSDVEESLPKVKIDRRRLSKVFVNLIENAIQHSPQKSTVTIEACRIADGNNEWVQCAIKDSGAGILAEDLPKIFEPFFSKRRGGTGLGLAIAHRIMQEHGGKLIAGNNPEGGACMIARFPIPTEGDA